MLREFPPPPNMEDELVWWLGCPAKTCEARAFGFDYYFFRVKHDWKVDSDGYRVSFDKEEYPYCRYIKCRRCEDWLCDNGCDGDVFNEECPSGQLELDF